jgi:release factor glutamine methyltransferase
MNIAQALSSAGFDRSEAEILLAGVLKLNRTALLAHPGDPLPPSDQAQWEEYAKRRRSGEPVSYITGKREFYGRTFLVDQRVHIPRPSTENLVTMVLAFLQTPKDEVRELETGIIGVAKILRDCSTVQTVVDVGTGSGCIAITIALERPDLHVIAIDISADALQVATGNAMRLGATNIEFFEGDLLSPVETLKKPFLVVSNPPYLSDTDIALHPALDAEPRISLYGGPYRDTVIRQLAQEAQAMEHCAGMIMERML